MNHQQALSSICESIKIIETQKCRILDNENVKKIYLSDGCVFPVVELSESFFRKCFLVYERTILNGCFCKITTIYGHIIFESTFPLKTNINSLQELQDSADKKQTIILSDNSKILAEDFMKYNGGSILAELASEKVFVCDKGD